MNLTCCPNCGAWHDPENKTPPAQRAEAATPKGWPWIEGNISIPAHIVQQCEVWTGTAGHAGIQTHYDNGEETPNRIALIKLNAELRALLNPPSMNKSP